MPSNPQKRVVIIGAGLGGISAAIMLKRYGFDVEIFEKNERVGGKLNRLSVDGFQFDLGPSILTLPQMFEPLFEGSGRTLSDYVPIMRLGLQWRNFFEDQTVLDLWEDPRKMRETLQSFGERTVREYFDFLEYSKRQYHLVERGYFKEGPDTFWELLRIYKLFGVFGMDFTNTMSQSIYRRVANPYLRDVFEYFIKYVGSSAREAPGFMNLMPNIQSEFGLWYVKGGLYELANGLNRRLEELKIPVHLGAEVLQIVKNGGGLVSGIRVRLDDGAVVERSADFVVSNMETIPAYERLLGEGAEFVKSLDKFEPTCSGIVIHLGTKKQYPQLAHHNFFYSRNQSRHFDRVFREKKLPDDPTIYLVAPTRSDSTQAPKGCENIKILPHIPYINSDSPFTQRDCEQLKDRVIDKLERMGLADLRKNTVVEDFWTPFDIEKKYYSNKGSIYGVVSDFKRNLGFKTPKQSTKYRNLFFTGGSVNPGGGMPMVVLCGQLVARKINESVRARVVPDTASP